MSCAQTRIHCTKAGTNFLGFDMISRRSLLISGGTLVAGSAAFVVLDGQNMLYAALAGDAAGGTLTVEEAHEMAVAGDVTLIDIRRPDEWSRTGSGEGAMRLDMRREDFVDELRKLVGDASAPIALICARGVRSARMTNILTEAGFTNIIDVPEGMLGSSAGAGWLRKGLPVVR